MIIVNQVVMRYICSSMEQEELAREKYETCVGLYLGLHKEYILSFLSSHKDQKLAKKTEVAGCFGCPQPLSCRHRTR